MKKAIRRKCQQEISEMAYGGSENGGNGEMAKANEMASAAIWLMKIGENNGEKPWRQQLSESVCWRRKWRPANGSGGGISANGGKYAMKAAAHRRKCDNIGNNRQK